MRAPDFIQKVRGTRDADPYGGPKYRYRVKQYPYPGSRYRYSAHRCLPRLPVSLPRHPVSILQPADAYRVTRYRYNGPFAQGDNDGQTTSVPPHCRDAPRGTPWGVSDAAIDLQNRRPSNGHIILLKRPGRHSRFAGLCFRVESATAWSVTVCPSLGPPARGKGGDTPSDSS